MIITGGIIGGAIPSVTNTDTGSYTGASVTTITYTSRSLGTAGRRWIVVGIGGGGTATISSVTVAGVTATSINTTTGAGQRSALYIAYVPTGTTGNVVITYGSATSSVHIGVYALYNLRSITPVDTATSNAGIDASLNADVSARGVVVAVVYNFSAGTPTLVGLTNLVTAFGGAQNVRCAQYTAVAAETPRTMTFDYAAGTSVACLATFR